MAIERLSRQLTHSGERLRVFRDRVRLANGLERDWDILEQPPVVVILPFEPTARGGRLLLVRQYRYAIAQDLLEFPAGTVEVGEEPAHTARRELAEETGLQAGRWDALGVVWRMPGVSDERTYFYLARQLAPTSGYEPDPEESIALEWLERAEFERRVGQGQIEDGKSLILWLLAQPLLA